MRRKNWMLVAFVMATALLFGVAGAGEQAEQAKAEEIVLDVQGMTCGSCAATESASSAPFEVPKRPVRLLALCP